MFVNIYALISIFIVWSMNSGQLMKEFLLLKQMGTACGFDLFFLQKHAWLVTISLTCQKKSFQRFQIMEMSLHKIRNNELLLIKKKRKSYYNYSKDK